MKEKKQFFRKILIDHTKLEFEPSTTCILLQIRDRVGSTHVNFTKRSQLEILVQII